MFHSCLSMSQTKKSMTVRRFCWCVDMSDKYRNSSCIFHPLALSTLHERATRGHHPCMYSGYRDIMGYLCRTKRQNLTLYLQVPRLRQKHPHWLFTGACHSPSAAAAAAASAVDAALFSPVFPTRSHPGEPTAPRILLWTFTWPKFLRFCDF